MRFIIIFLEKKMGGGVAKNVASVRIVHELQANVLCKEFRIFVVLL